MNIYWMCKFVSVLLLGSIVLDSAVVERAVWCSWLDIYCNSITVPQSFTARSCLGDLRLGRNEADVRVVGESQNMSITQEPGPGSTGTSTFTPPRAVLTPPADDTGANDDKVRFNQCFSFLRYVFIYFLAGLPFIDCYAEVTNLFSILIICCSESRHLFLLCNTYVIVFFFFVTDL